MHNMKLTEPASNAVSVVCRRAIDASFLPIAREMHEAAPASKPIMMLLRNQIIGNVKLIAASGASPSRDTKNRSTASNEMIATSPIAIGVAWRRK